VSLVTRSLMDEISEEKELHTTLEQMKSVDFVKRRRFYFGLLLALLGSIILSYTVIMGSVQLRLFALFLLAFAILQTPYKHRFSILLYVIPFGGILKFPYFEFSFGTILIGLFVLAWLFRSPKLSSSVMAIFLSLGFVAATNLSTTPYLRYLGWLLNLMVMFIVISDLSEQTMILEWIYCFSLGVLLTCFIAYFVPEIPLRASLSKESMYVVRGNLFVRFQGLMQDANYFSQILLICISLLVWCMSHLRSILHKMITLLLVGMLTLSGILSLSKMFLVVIPLPLIQLLVVSGSKKDFAKSIFLVMLVILVPLAFFSILNPGKLDTLIEVYKIRFSDLTSGRIDSQRIWIGSVENNLERLIMGYGLGAESGMLRYVNSTAPHNVYLEFLYMFGAVGSVLWVLWLFSLYEYSKTRTRRRSSRFPDFFPMIVLLVTGFSLDGAAQDYLYLFWILTISVLVVSRENTSTKV
jgi:O-antigen ligase